MEVGSQGGRDVERKERGMEERRREGRRKRGKKGGRKCFFPGRAEPDAHRAVELWPSFVKMNFKAAQPCSAPQSLNRVLIPHWPHECPQSGQTQVEAPL